MKKFTLQERAQFYSDAHRNWPPLRADGRWIDGMWIMGNNYKTNASKYYGAYPHTYLERVGSLFPDAEPDQVLHLFSGSMAPGPYVRFDRLASKADVVGDAEQLANYFPTRTFELIFADPPYSVEDCNRYGCSMINRKKVLSECVKILKPGGFIPEGSFHPKVWVTHYRPRKIAGSEQRPEILRVICASRNLTINQCWEAFVAFEGDIGKAKVNSELNRGVIDFVKKLTATVPFQSSIMVRLCEALNRVRFTLPRPFQKGAEFLWQWHQGPALLQQLPAAGLRALIVSPFIRKTFVERILDRFEQTILISTQQELDAIESEDFITKLCGGKNRVFVVEPIDTDTGETAMDLHAKLLIFEDANGTKTYLGSANASHTAWSGRNCEAVMCFAPGVSIDHFCDRFVYDEAPAQSGGRRPLKGWISEYRRQPQTNDPEDRAERELNEVCSLLSRLTLVASYDAGAKHLQLVGELVPAHVQSALEQWGTAFEMRVGLLSQLHSDAALKPLGGLFQGGLFFWGVAVADLTEFVILEVTHRQFGVSRRFIIKLKADFSAWRDERDAQLIQQLLTRDSLQTFLRAILFDAATRPPVTLSSKQAMGGVGASTWSLLSGLTIEDVIRACTEDSSRIEEINQVLKAFENTEWIDEEFRVFWKAFVAAESAARGELINA